jgi:hypothetical protein
MKCILVAVLLSNIEECPGPVNVDTARLEARATLEERDNAEIL